MAGGDDDDAGEPLPDVRRQLGEAAFKHYEKALGGRIVELARFADAPKGAAPADKKTANWVMHVRLEVGNNVIMGSDAPSEHFQAPQGMSVSVNVDDPEQAETIFAALADGGRQTMPMAETFWARRFGMLVDRYGIPWMVNCQKSGPAR